MDLQRRREQPTILGFDGGIGRWHKNAEMVHRVEVHP
jgi:hypothetical protein